MQSEIGTPVSSAACEGDGDADCLLCCEDAAAALVETDQVSNLSNDGRGYLLSAETQDELAEEIASGESNLSARPLPLRHVDAAARSAAVEWILEVRLYYGFMPQTAYLATNYMDRFLSLNTWPQAYGWAMQLIAVTCLSLASKMEETLVPSLMDLQIDGTRFVFEPRTILRMELLVLAALQWRLWSVTPFPYVHLFASKIDSTRKNTNRIVLRAMQIILSAMLDVEFSDHSPSSIAAAAVLCASSQMPAPALWDPCLAAGWCSGLAEEGISSCYQLMKQQLATTASSSSPPQPKRRKRDLLQ